MKQTAEERKALLKFSCFLTAVIAALISILIFKNKTEAIWLLSGLIPGILYIILPSALIFLENSLICLGHILGTVNSFIIFFFLFFLILTPLALLKRIFKGVTLPRGKSNDESYWSDVQSECNWKRQF